MRAVEVPPFQCPQCGLERAVEQPRVEQVVSLGGLLQGHLVERHRFTQADAFMEVEAWVHRACAAIHGAAPPGPRRAR